MVIKPVPNQCIWCLQKSPTATFKSESHVLPQSIGNIKQQVLLPGIVCDSCNNFFAHDLEPNLVDDPLISTVVGILHLRDPDSEFVYKRSSSSIHRNVNMETVVSGNVMTVNTRYEIQGQPDKPTEVRQISKSKVYDKRALVFHSREFHKIAFETAAHTEFVGTGIKYRNKELGTLDVFDPSFNVIREWVRCGKPQQSVRPALQIQKFDEARTLKQLPQWGGRSGYFRQWFYYEINVYNVWYVLSLTSPSNRVKDDLVNWLKKRKPNHQVWMIGDALELIDKSLWV